MNAYPEHTPLWMTRCRLLTPSRDGRLDFIYSDEATVFHKGARSEMETA